MVQNFVEQFTYIGMFLALLAGSLGVPLPEETVIIAGGVLAHEEVVRWGVALPVCLIGVLSGDVVLYWVGHHWGLHVLAWRPVQYAVTPERAQALIAAYQRHGVKIVFAARHVIGLRAAAFLTAGIARLPFWKFLLVDAAAACVGVPLSFGLAYFFTDQLQNIVDDVHRLERWLVVFGLAALVVWLMVRIWRKNREALAAESGEDSVL